MILVVGPGGGGGARGAVRCLHLYAGCVRTREIDMPDHLVRHRDGRSGSLSPCRYYHCCIPAHPSTCLSVVRCHTIWEWDLGGASVLRWREIRGASVQCRREMHDVVRNCLNRKPPAPLSALQRMAPASTSMRWCSPWHTRASMAHSCCAFPRSLATASHVSRCACAMCSPHCVAAFCADWGGGCPGAHVLSKLFRFNVHLRPLSLPSPPLPSLPPP